MLLSDVLSASPRRRVLSAALLASALLGQGCFERPLSVITPCAVSTAQQPERVVATDQVDLLFVIDDSRSMREEQAALTREISSMVTTLTTGDAERGVPAVRSLHVGVVSTDMGVGDNDPVNGCTRGAGHAGLLRAPSEAGGESRQAVLEFDAGDDVAAFAAEVSLVATLGDDGCNFEQPLESMLTALSPSGPTDWTARDYVSPTFGQDGLGQAGPDGANDGFMRPGAVLAVVMITDEDDCSAEDTSFFSGADGSFMRRCADHHAQQYATERYVSGLIGLRHSPSQIVFAAIVGIPESAEGADVGALLAGDTIAETVTNNRVDASCVWLDAQGQPNVANGQAEPPRRIAEVALGLEERGASARLYSICTGDYHHAIDDVAARIGGALGTACLPRALNRDAAGEVDCVVLERLPALESGAELTHCADLPGAEAYTLERVELVHVGGVTMHREVCRVQQVVAGEGGTGWYYDDSASASDCSQRIAYADIQPIGGAVLEYSCSERVFPATGAAVQLGTFCAPDGGAGLVAGGLSCASGIAAPGYSDAALSCDSFDRTCQLACDDSSDCTAGGLAGHVCDLREAQEIYGRHLPAGVSPTAIHGVCVNPTCHED